jgi:hypothetical protein
MEFYGTVLFRKLAGLGYNLWKAKRCHLAIKVNDNNDTVLLLHR